MNSASDSKPEFFSDVPELSAPPMSAALSAALESTEPVALRQPTREFGIFLVLSLPFFALMLAVMGIRQDISELSTTWLASVGLLWFASFAVSAYLGFVPAKGHVTPRSRSIWQTVAASSLLLIAVGLFASQGAEGLSTTYTPSVENVVAHAGHCSMLGIFTGLLPGVVVLLLMRRYVPVGRASIGLSLGAAGGSLAGLALLFHCPISERFHMGLVHGGAVVIAAVFLAGVSQILLRER